MSLPWTIDLLVSLLVSGLAAVHAETGDDEFGKRLCFVRL